MELQLDLFSTSNTDYEEERKGQEKQRNVALAIERKLKERQEFLTKNLTPRQHRLVDYLKDNFVSGKYFSIEEICESGLGYELNKNPYTHDKCVSLGNDIRQINWAIGSRYSIIVKDKKVVVSYAKVNKSSMNGNKVNSHHLKENGNTLTTLNIKQVSMTQCRLSILMIEH